MLIAMNRIKVRNRIYNIHCKSIFIVLVFTIIFISIELPKTNAQRDRGALYGEIDGMEIFDPDLPLGFRKYDRITVDVNITSGGPADIYLLKESEYKKLEENLSFKATVSKERANHTKFKWEKLDDKTYYLVIDNMDNAHTNDAIPTDLTYNYTADIEERHHDVEMRHILIAGVIIALVIIIITIVALVVILKRR